ncbi:synaptic vesicle 2-related protein-like [Babylonia areolata]|uniref:synaptic vesicle 2-related protein-like n=1 Tax=Babylonia areolata TaxID=304850 RepID=UPI003FD69F0A
MEEDHTKTGGTSHQLLVTSPAEDKEDHELEQTDTEKHQLDDVLSSMKFGLYQIQMLALVGGGYFAVCAEFMLFVFLSSPVRAEWNLADYEFPWLPFSSGVVGIVGGFVFGTVSDRFGRRVPFIVGMTCVAVFGLASAFARSFPLFIAFRCVVIFGTAAFKCVGFVLLLEFLPRERRGTVMVVVTLCGALGAVLVASLAWAMLESLGWRWFVGTCSAPAWLVLAMALCLLKESPRFLFASGQAEKGAKVLRAVADRNKVCLVQGDILCPPSEQRGDLRQLFSGVLLWQTVLLSLVWFLQSTGFWGVTTYLPEYMATRGVNPYLNMFSVFIGEIPGLILAMVLIEKRSIGRINCLRMFSSITLVALVAFAFVPLHQLKTVFAIVVFFSMVPIYSVLNTFTPEVYPTHIRSIAMGWVNVVMEIPGLITPFVGELLLSSSIEWLYPVVWASVFAAQLAVTLGLGKETAGQNLEDGVSGDKPATTGLMISGENLEDGRS